MTGNVGTEGVSVAGQTMEGHQESTAALGATSQQQLPETRTGGGRKGHPRDGGKRERRTTLQSAERKSPWLGGH